MCKVLTQQGPSTQIAFFERTRQSAWLGAATTQVDKTWVKSCVLKHLFFWGRSATKNCQKAPTRCWCQVFMISRLALQKKNQLSISQLEHIPQIYMRCTRSLVAWVFVFSVQGVAFLSLWRTWPRLLALTISVQERLRQQDQTKQKWFFCSYYKTFVITQLHIRQKLWITPYSCDKWTWGLTYATSYVGGISIRVLAW